MRRPLPLALALACCLAALGTWVVLRTDPARAATAVGDAGAAGAPPAADAPERSSLAASGAALPDATAGLLPERIPDPPAAAPEPLAVPAIARSTWLNTPPPPAHAFPTGTIVGRLLDARGRPAGGVLLELLVTGNAGFFEPEALRPLVVARARSRSDSDGRFGLSGAPADTELRLLVRQRSGSDEIRESLSVPGDQTLDLGDVLLAPPLHCSGRVLGADGSPIAGAEILSLGLLDWMSVIAEFPEHAELATWQIPAEDQAILDGGMGRLVSRTAHRARTRADGSFDFETSTGAHDNLLVARAPGLVLQIHEWSQQRDDPLEFVLRPGTARIAGRVIRSDGASPLSGAIVIARRHGDHDATLPSTARTDTEGRFEFIGLTDGSCDLTAYAPDLEPEKASEVAAGRDDVELALRPGRAAEFRVVDADGRQVPEFDLAWRPPPVFLDFSAPNVWHGGHAGPETSGVLRIAGGKSVAWLFQASTPDGLCSAGTSLCVDFAVPATRYTLELAPRRELRGTVVVAGEGAPLADALIDVRCDGKTTLPWGFVRSGDDGAFRVAPLPPGRAQVFVTRPGFLPEQAECPAVNDGPLRIELRRSPTRP
ncbi:MAG TPA: carboxypeptidase-like regulatory domain-containing protein [Planctomycetota bacterium]|nr:carboxypeptidase-like regulatory domain-containing protein [Planctomycetota bacterium]